MDSEAPGFRRASSTLDPEELTRKNVTYPSMPRASRCCIETTRLPVVGFSGAGVCWVVFLVPELLWHELAKPHSNRVTAERSAIRILMRSSIDRPGRATTRASDHGGPGNMKRVAIYTRVRTKRQPL